MKISENDFYHGAALTQIVEHPSFKALNKATAKFGHFIVNKDITVLVKYRKKARGSSWVFTFSLDDMQTISHDARTGKRPYVALVCGDITVCGLTIDQLRQTIDLRSNRGQTLTVNTPRRLSIRISGSKGKLPGTIAHKAFPDMLFS
jgi:hypothetical protein